LLGCRLQHRALQVATQRCTLQHGVLQCAASVMLCAARCNAARCISLAACVVCCRRDVHRLRSRAPLHACSAEVVACNGDADDRSGCAFQFLAAVAAAAWTCTPPLVCRAASQCRLPRAAARACVVCAPACSRPLQRRHVHVHVRHRLRRDHVHDRPHWQPWRHAARRVRPADVRVQDHAHVRPLRPCSTQTGPHLCAGAQTCASPCACVPCARAHACICHKHTHARSVSSGFIVSAGTSPHCAARITCWLHPRACVCVRLCVRVLRETRLVRGLRTYACTQACTRAHTHARLHSFAKARTHRSTQTTARTLACVPAHPHVHPGAGAGVRAANYTRTHT
jgi:hypothetical protein